MTVKQCVGGAVAIVALAALVSVLALSVLPRRIDKCRIGLDEYERLRLPLSLPAGATNIDVGQEVAWGERTLNVRYEATEDVFRFWAGSNGWTPEPIVGSVTFYPPCGRGVRPEQVFDGLLYSTEHAGVAGAISVVLDRRHNRVYYHYSSQRLGSIH
jgi:hypothetical protein